MISESPKPRRPFRKIGRHRRDEFSLGFTDSEIRRVRRKNEALGVESEAGERKAGVRARPAVFRIAEDRITFRFEVNSNLMAPAGRDSDAREKSGRRADVSETLEDLDLRKGGLPFDRPIHAKRGEARMTARESEVFFLDPMFFKPSIRRAMSVFVASDEEHAARLAIDPVDREVRTARIESRKEFEHARLARVRARDRKEARGLVHGHKVCVFPENREFGVHALTVSG